MSRLFTGTPGWTCAYLICAGLAVPGAVAQQAQVITSATVSLQAPAQAISLDDAITRAKANEPTFAAAVANGKVAALDRSLARAALLPNVVYHNQFLYTEPAHGATNSGNASAAIVQSTPRFIANNAVHEYMSQGVVTETIGAQQFAAAARASAASAAVTAELEIARRGLVATVVSLYYKSLAAEHKLTVAQHALDEATDFANLTQNREQAREAAHADVIKAQLTLQQRQRDLDDAKLQSERARLELAVLLFPDPRTAYTLADFTTPAPLAAREEFEATAAHDNPELKSALASLRASSLDVVGARAAYLPDLGLNFAYGIDSAQFAVHAPDGTRNLGYSASLTLDIPVWDWFSTHDRIKQKVALRDSAKVALTAAQRKLIAQIDEFYAEANVARGQLASFDESASTARESLRLTRLRYSAGEATVLEVVDAENTLTISETAREDGVVRYQTALANLQILTGSL